MSALEAVAVSDDTTMGVPLAAAKQQLRGLMKQRLSAIPQESVSRQSKTGHWGYRDEGV